MKDVHPLDVAVLVAIESIRGLALLLVPLVALVLTIAGWRPAAAEPEPGIPAPLTAEPPGAPTGAAAPVLTTVKALRQQARALGLPSRQWKSARKAELLELLAVS